MRFKGTCTITRLSLDARGRDSFDVPIGAKPDATAVCSGRCQVFEDQTKISRLPVGDLVPRSDRGGFGIDAMIRLERAPSTRINPETDRISANFNGLTKTGRILGREDLVRYPRITVRWDATN